MVVDQNEPVVWPQFVEDREERLVASLGFEIPDVDRGEVARFRCIANGYSELPRFFIRIVVLSVELVADEVRIDIGLGDETTGSVPYEPFQDIEKQATVFLNRPVTGIEGRRHFAYTTSRLP